MSIQSTKLGSFTHGLLCILTVLGLLIFPPQFIGAPVSQTWTDVIVQGRPNGNLTELVLDYGGQVGRELSVINAVAARVPTDRLAALKTAPGVVQSLVRPHGLKLQTAQTRALFIPHHMVQRPNQPFLTSPRSQHVMTVKKTWNTSRMVRSISKLTSHIPSSLSNRLATCREKPACKSYLKRKSLNQAQLLVYQASTIGGTHFQSTLCGAMMHWSMPASI